MNESTPQDTVRRYYAVHAGGEYVESELLALLDEQLLERILVDELGGDTLEQAFYEGSLFHPAERFDDAAVLAEATHDARIEGSTAEVAVGAAVIELIRTDDSWTISAFR